MFSGIPDYARGRALNLRTTPIQGEDVFALQCAMVTLLRNQLKTDGVFGKRTKGHVQKAQSIVGARVDGVAGVETRSKIVLAIARPVTLEYELPQGALHGQLAHESGLDPGIYSWIIRQAEDHDGHPNPALLEKGVAFDAGVGQLNSDYYELRDAFDPIYAIDKLGKDTRAAYGRLKGIKNRRRRWKLAMGHHNAPAFAYWIANEEGAQIPRGETRQPSQTARVKLETYMDDVSVLLKV